MTTMTIHAEDDFAVALREYAAKLGKSVNRTVKDVFAPILGMVEGEKDRQNPWGRFAGALPDIDCERWDSEISSGRAVDAELWK